MWIFDGFSIGGYSILGKLENISSQVDSKYADILVKFVQCRVWHNQAFEGLDSSHREFHSF